ncbi:hypothetical protein BpHYR1_036664 [Brachionus plicatilis]|uniref:Uncharacterized protein n=1 Tax=Brachionus plicatilis TaxID=10195 RepID=A0A3M7PCN2_BRAPC|nr:hypothetical protein BpHYR1_036664 [Brachionus plicatilis]
MSSEVVDVLYTGKFVVVCPEELVHKLCSIPLLARNINHKFNRITTGLKSEKKKFLNILGVYRINFFSNSKK